ASGKLKVLTKEINTKVFTSHFQPASPLASFKRQVQHAAPKAKWLGLAYFVAFTCTMALAIVGAFALAIDEWNLMTAVITVMIAATALWISGGAATALLGLIMPSEERRAPPLHWQPRGRTAILITLCGEDPKPLASYLRSFTNDLAAAQLSEQAPIFVISDTPANAADAEASALSSLIAHGLITYRRRDNNHGKKPGNISDWLAQHGAHFDYMLVKDTDSRMSVNCVRQLIFGLETKPNTGLLQSGISVLPAQSRFGRYQRNSSRLLGRNFGRGFAAWSGNAGNYWGHNAIMRIEAFRVAAKLPVLSGNGPLGGSILSHDFVEAAWMRRAGWDIELMPDLRGSAEDAPQTVSAFFRRDRRWCQGNLQHMRLLTEPNLHPVSRLHLITGIFSYISAPIWLLLIGLLSVGLVSVQSYWSILLVAIVLLIPKLCALVEFLPKARTWKRRATYMRASASEFLVSVLVAPLISIHHAKSVLAVLMGFDCGWKSNVQPRWHIREGWLEAAIGLSLLIVGVVSSTVSVLWLAPIIVPLLIAPVMIPILDGEPR
ncbi:MAG: glucans biosynthesis glucosyltransferase MdoH, partial [Ahrensia sp.]